MSEPSAVEEADVGSTHNRSRRAARSRALAYVPRPPLRLAATLVAMLGAALIIAGSTVVIPGLRARAWPSVAGLVHDARVTVDTVGIVWGRRWSYPARQRRTHVTYTYVVDGREYSGTRIGLRDDAARTIGTRPLYGRGPVAVHYDPASPANALLDASIPWGNVANVFLGIVAVLLSITLFRKAAR